MRYIVKKITVINGCEKFNSIEKTVMEALQSNLNLVNAAYDWNDLKDKELRICRACDVCQTKTPGLCAIQDGVNEVLRQYINSDVAIIIAPIAFGCGNSLIKNFLDRTEPLFLPYQILHKHQTVMKKRYKQYPHLIFIGIADNSSEACRNEFTKFIENSNLFRISDKAQVHIFNKDDNVNELGKWLETLEGDVLNEA